MLNEFLDFNVTMDYLANSASTALGSMLGKVKSNQDLGYLSHTKLFDSLVVPILDYRCGTWSTGQNCKNFDQIQNGVICYYLGVPRTSPIVGIEGDMGWILGIVRCDVKSLHFYNQLMWLPNTRLPRKLYNIDKVRNGPWSKNLEELAKCVDALAEWNRNELINIKKTKVILIESYNNV